MLALSLKTTVRIAVIGLTAGSIAVVSIMASAYVTLDKTRNDVGFFEALNTNVSKFNLLTAELFVQRSERVIYQWNRQHEALGRQLHGAPNFNRQANMLVDEIGLRLETVGQLVANLKMQSQAKNENATPDRETHELLFESVTVQSGEIVSRALELRKLTASVAEKQRRQFFLMAGSGFLALIIGGGLVLILITNGLLSRILKLRAVIQEIGQGNLDAEIPLPKQDEMGDVFRQLHQMRLSLLESMGELSRVNLELVAAKTDLEDRVAERTAGLEAANKELEAFTYAVSHDLRSPLRAISGFSQAVLEDYGSQLDPEGQAMLRRIHGATQRMSQLIDDLLKLSRLNKSLSNVTDADFSKIASEICEGLQERALGRKVSFKIESNVTLRCDAGLMRVVLTNLIENAWKFTAQKPDAEIEFGRRVENGAETLFIRDNGAGFDMAFSERLFQPFQRLHSENAFPGTGIGLATVARIVRLHGGKIWAEARPGEGATFYFRLGKTLPSSTERDLSGVETNASDPHRAQIRKAATG